MYQNYLPYNLESFTITDAYGNRASGGADSPPGGGGGRLSCCYALKGTEFTVKWDYVDVDQWHQGDERVFSAETKVSMPSTPLPKDIGARILEVHFYPDHHAEFQFPGQLLDDARLPIVDVARWMDRFQEKLDKRYDERDDQQFRRISRVVASAWLKYHLTNLQDLEQYAYFDLLINEQFDSHPEVQRILQNTMTKPGEFAKEIRMLPESVLSDLKNARFVPAPVPTIPGDLLPPPRNRDSKPQRENSNA